MVQERSTIKYRRYYSHRGSSLITVLIVIVVLMVIVLSVLAVSYQYFMTQANSIYHQKCQETAYSLSQELQGEIAGKKFNEYSEQAVSRNELWLYLRETIAQESTCANAWPYYYDGSIDRKPYTGDDAFIYDMDDWKRAADLEEAKRYFKLQPTDSANSLLNEELPKTTVCMYWEPGKYTDRAEDIRLHVIVTSQLGDYTYTIRDVYRLQTEMYTDSGADAVTKVNAAVNTGAEIYKYQEWEWIYDGEE